MKIYWVNNYFPAFVFVTDFGVSANMGATTYGPFIFIRPSRTFPSTTKERAEGLLHHELTHSRQFWNPRKWFVGRLAWEVEAYREQLKYVPEDLDKLADILATRYGFNITKEEATILIRAGSGI